MHRTQMRPHSLIITDDVTHYCIQCHTTFFSMEAADKVPCKPPFRGSEKDRKQRFKKYSRWIGRKR